MSYVTEATAWLSDDINDHVKALIARFYELADSKQPDAGHLMASEVFTDDAVLISPQGRMAGFREISKSRDTAWSVVSSRSHTISKVFAGGAKSPELALLGAVNMGFTNGKGVTSPFAVHIKLTDLNAPPSQLRITFMEVFAVSLFALFS
ncbi:hypothetical protein B0J13DRAFT_432830 [Dactylonectria estremocensis]|uniref:SnoaL-like domain-containing protein n=1 Tax=Dactylonectria estremocensis TaxID=1079267 RepID=A0A9P9JHP0_9HYPO|nr:hypothetical protein B0J13DRAFT_432830 [Dactylonectria estremocensis]